MKYLTRTMLQGAALAWLSGTGASHAQDAVLVAANAACGQTDGIVATVIWPTVDAGDVLVLATSARQPTVSVRHDPKWRFRALEGPPALRIEAVALSPDASYADVRYRGHQNPVRADLTQQVEQLPEPAGRDGKNLPGSSRTYRERQSVACPTVNSALPAAERADLLSELSTFMRDRGFPAQAQELDVTIFGVAPDPALYAPVLQLFKSEEVWPSAFEVWNDIVPSGITATSGGGSHVSETLLEMLFRNYKRTNRQCVIYYTTDFQEKDQRRQGSWVIQYWFYYPFDVGGVGPHLHDSEHLFVEVDKLGGTVRRVAAAGHGNWAPNNIYTTYRANAVPVQLPLFAVVEYGKHATAPDIDGDGWFTPGVDVNAYYDAAKVWGVRDTIGTTDSNLKAFSATMMVKRDRKFALASKELTENYPGLLDGQIGHVSCTLRPLPEYLSAQRCDGATAGCARSQVGSHTDFKNSERILKPALYPPFAVRATYTRIPTATDGSLEGTERSDRATVGFAFELARLVGGTPGRAAVDVLLDLRDEGRVSPRVNGVSTRYELLTSNLTGLYGGLSWIFDDLPAETPSCALQSSPCVRENLALWLSAGGLLEVPLRGRLTLQPSAGLTYNNFFGLAWEARIGLGYALFSPNRDFGIKARQPNPY